MKDASQLVSKLSVPRFSTLLLAFTVGLAAGFITGCGSTKSMSNSPVLSGNTSITVLVSSTANDRLSQFNVGLTSIVLTNKAGKTVSLFSTPQNPEFIHVNGTAEPLVTVSVPQDVYTAATPRLRDMVASPAFPCFHPADFRLAILRPRSPRL